MAAIRVFGGIDKLCRITVRLIRATDVAITDRDQLLASPYENYDVRGREQDAVWFREFVQNERVAFFVVGLPVHLSGEESQKSLEARQFGEWLAGVTEKSVYYFDERFTSKHAEGLLQEA